MRVIAGVAKGRKLRPVPGSSTRPITDRVKVALFDILAPEIEGARVLDLFAGTGGVGIEALSRGASRAVFVDREPLAVKTIRENLSLTGLEARAEVVRLDSFRYLDRPPTEAFELIYIAPPQYRGLWKRAVELLDQRPAWLAADGTSIVQIDPREYEPAVLGSLGECDRRRYGSTLLCFFERPGT